jgi:4-diphosphocytidyl-2-C-methyl-D-erythritol kinase
MNVLYDLPAPAKLNLFLHILGRRTDGYHLLQSVFALTDWCDRLHIEPRSDGKICRIDIDEHDRPLQNPVQTRQLQPASLALPADDLCVKAAKLLQTSTHTRAGANIYLHKCLPAQAGMGGGSSDAATCLLALNRLWGTGLNRRELQILSLTLGADVPFFIVGQHAWVEGIGENIQPIALAPRRFAVLKPAAGISTQDIFSNPQLTRSTKPATISGFTAISDDFGQNDLQPVAEMLCPDVGFALKRLTDLGLNPRMTGSGSAVFSVCSEKFSFSPSVNLPEGWSQKICQTLVEHPLKNWCES